MSMDAHGTGAVARYRPYAVALTVVLIVMFVPAVHRRTAAGTDHDPLAASTTVDASVPSAADVAVTAPATVMTVPTGATTPSVARAGSAPTTHTPATAAKPAARMAAV